VVTASWDETARIWDAKSGQPIGAPLTHEDRITSASFSPDGSRVVTASYDKTACIWDAISGQPIGAPLTHDGSVRSASFSSDGARVVTASDDNTARIWDAKSGQPIGTPLTHQGNFTSASFSPDGSRVLTTSSDNTARIWDAISGQPIGIPLTHQGNFTSASFSPDGSRVVTASYDNTARIWDAKSGQPISIPLTHKDSLPSASFGPDGSRVLTASEDKTARVRDVRTGQVVSADLAEMLTAFSGGARLDPELGSLQFLSEAERLALAEALAPLFDTSEDWRFAASLRLPNDPQTTPVSPRMTMTIRDVSARLIGTLSIPLIREAAACDPNHPVLPFAHALIEVRETLSQPANPIRTAWLCDYGMKHFPADTSAADLRLATRLVAEVAKTIPEQKATALLLLDRAAKLAPEDEDTKALRERLK
jgi:WD40 repeat protein